MEYYGYRGKILEVDLTSQKTEVKELSHDDIVNFIGGAGMNSWILYKNCKPDTKPFDPENPLIFGAGPFVGTEFPSSGRSTFTALSPLTGILGDANGGGYFAPMVKQAGYDHLVIRGKSENPCYLLIGRDGACTIEKADDVWGKDITEADTILSKKHPGSMTACIGPAGENLVTYANILTNKAANSWSRTGVGAVMGSKRLKAIVANGRGKIPIKDPDRFEKISEGFKKVVNEGLRSKIFSRWGTIMQITVFSALGLMYRNNLRHAVTFNYADKLGLKTFSDRAEFKNHGCFRCPIKCEKPYVLKDKPYRGEEGSKYELGYACTLGFNVGIDNINSVLHLVRLCNDKGMDVVDLSSSIATAIDLYKEGIISNTDTDGIELDWNKTEAVESLIKKIASKEGFGEILSGGVKSIAEIIGKGADKYAIHIKGMSEPAHCCPPFLLSFAVASRGGDHLKGMPILALEGANEELAQKFYNATKGSMDLFSHNDKGRVVWWHENYKTIIDSLGTCFFLSTILLPQKRFTPEELAKAYNAATGVEIDGQALFLTGERSYQIQKAFNALRGVDRSNDNFKVRPEKDSWGHGIDINHPGMLDEYYHYRGCSKDGLPTRERLEETGLKHVADDLEKEGRLGRLENSKEYMSVKNLGSSLIDYDKKSKQEEFVDSLAENPKLFDFISGPLVMNTVSRIIEIKRKLTKFLKSKHGSAVLIGIGVAAMIVFLLQSEK